MCWSILEPVCAHKILAVPLEPLQTSPIIVAAAEPIRDERVFNHRARDSALTAVWDLVRHQQISILARPLIDRAQDGQSDAVPLRHCLDWDRLLIPAPRSRSNDFAGLWFDTERQNHVVHAIDRTSLRLCLSTLRLSLLRQDRVHINTVDVFELRPWSSRDRASDSDVASRPGSHSALPLPRCHSVCRVSAPSAVLQLRI